MSEGIGFLEGEDEEGHERSAGECRSSLIVSERREEGPERGIISSGDLTLGDTISCIGGRSVEWFYNRSQITAFPDSCLTSRISVARVFEAVRGISQPLPAGSAHQRFGCSGLFLPVTVNDDLHLGGKRKQDSPSYVAASMATGELSKYHNCIFISAHVHSLPSPTKIALCTSLPPIKTWFLAAQRRGGRY